MGSTSMSDSSSSSSSSSSGDEDNDDEEENEEDENAMKEDSVDKSGLNNPEVGSEVKEVTSSSNTSDTALGLEKTSGQKNLVKEEKEEENLEKAPGGDMSGAKATPSTECGKGD